MSYVDGYYDDHPPKKPPKPCRWWHSWRREGFEIVRGFNLMGHLARGVDLVESCRDCGNYRRTYLGALIERKEP